MDLINRSDLSPMARARLDASLAKLFRYSDGVRSLGDEIARMHAAGELVGKKSTDGMIDWNRRRFNNMRGPEQKAYERRLADRRYYWLHCTDGTGSKVPKIVFDAMALPIMPGSLAEARA